MDHLYHGTFPDRVICTGILSLPVAFLAIEVLVGLSGGVCVQLLKLMPAVDGVPVVQATQSLTPR